MDAVSYTPIGIIRTPHTAIEGMPVQNVGAADVRGTIEIAPEYAAGLRDLRGLLRTTTRSARAAIRVDLAASTCNADWPSHSHTQHFIPLPRSTNGLDSPILQTASNSGDVGKLAEQIQTLTGGY